MVNTTPNEKVELGDLPDDILFEIINEDLLSPPDLYCLATLSHRLQSIALPLYLRIHGLSHPQTRSAIYLECISHRPLPTKPTVDGLSGLAIMTNLTSIDHLVCSIPVASYEFQTPNEHKISQLLRVIHRLHSVTTVEIEFKPIISFKDSNFPSISDAKLQAWTTDVATLLNTVVEKGCIRLSVQGAMMRDAYTFHVENRPYVKPFVELARSIIQRDAGFKATMTCLQGPHWEYRRPQLAGYYGRIEMQPSPDVLKKCQMRFFAIHSGILLVPPQLNWTISILRFCTSITSISFGTIGMESDRWKAMLFCVADALSGRLEEVSFLDCWGLKFSDVLKFLSRTPSLTRLEMPSTHSYTVQIQWRELEALQVSGLTIPRLPKLEILTGPFLILNSLLRFPRFTPSTTPPLPSLREWTIHFGLRIFDNYEYIKECTSRHSTFRQRLLSRKGINADLEFCVCITGRRTDRVSALGTDYSRVLRAIASKNLPAFELVTYLVLEDTPQWETSNHIFTMVGLMFPDLRELKVSRESTGEGNVTSPRVEAALSDLRRACAKLEKVVTGEHIFDLPADGSPIIKS